MGAVNINGHDGTLEMIGQETDPIFEREQPAVNRADGFRIEQ